LEDLEKVTGLTFTEPAGTTEAAGSNPDKTEEMLQHAKHIIQKGPGSDDSSEQYAIFQETIKKYMEMARLGSSSSSSLANA
jgi:hypothetical protein